jgi:hypothetical protein
MYIDLLPCVEVEGLAKRFLVINLISRKSL